jgi:predicted RNase H-like HicB family nuclease
MRKLVIPVEVEPLEEGGYLAVCEPIQGCHAEGDTVAEALENLEDVARTLLELRVEDGLPTPDGLETYEPGKTIRAQLVVPAGD